MVIRTNLPAMNAYRNSAVVNAAVAKSMEKMSSGYRINRAADDAAGLAISEKMRGQIKGTEMGTKNAMKGISLIATAEGGMEEIHAILHRMRELAIQSTNQIYRDEDRALIDLEFQQLKGEIDRIAESTHYNGIKLIDGSLAMGSGSAVHMDDIINDAFNAVLNSSALLSNTLASTSEFLNAAASSAWGGIMPATTTSITPLTAPSPNVTINAATLFEGASGSGWNFNSGVLTISGDDVFLIQGALPANSRIVVDSGVTASIILDNVDINANTGAALDMRGAAVDLWLTGNNTLTATANGSAGIQTFNGILTINGAGALVARGGNGTTGVGGIGAGAGIGGGGTNNIGEDGGLITINSGSVTAVGGGGGTVHSTAVGGIAAGIGGGGGVNAGGGGGSITINGGTVTATGGTGAAGVNFIGSSMCGVGGAGIGGGSGGSTGSAGGSGGNIIITGGIVTALGGNASSCSGGRAGAGIGGGWGASAGGDGGTILITNTAIVTARAGASTIGNANPGMAIGGGNSGSWGAVGNGVGGRGSFLTIAGGLLEIADGQRVGGGSNSTNHGTTTVTGGNLSTQNTDPATAIRSIITDGVNQAWRAEIFLYDSNGDAFPPPAGYFPPRTEVSYTLTIGGVNVDITAITDSRGRLYMYLPPGNSGTAPIATMTMTQANNPTLGLPEDLYGWLLTEKAEHTNRLEFAEHRSHIPVRITGEAIRTGDTGGRVNFESNFPGTYYYIVRGSGEPAPTVAELLASPNSAPGTAGENTFNLANLTTGTHRVYLILVNEDNARSNMLSLPIPPVGGGVLPPEPPPEPPIVEPPIVDPPTKPEPEPKPKLGGGLVIHYGANSEERIRVFIGGMGVEALDIVDTCVDHWERANEAISQISKAVGIVSSERANLGAYQNRIESIVNDNAVKLENLVASESVIRDLDMALEMIAFTNKNIIAQSAQAMLAQANQLPQGLLQLLQ